MEARPRGGPSDLLYISQDLERFQMAVQRLVLIHPRELELIKKEDFITAQEKVNMEDTAEYNAMDIAKIILKDNTKIKVFGKLSERQI